MAVFLAVFAVAGTFVGGLTGPVVRAESVATNFPVHAEFRPNDPYYLDQWGMQKIGAPNAWDVTLGKPSVVVAVVDTGVWWTHQDIQANMWVNPADGTTHGYDFISGDTNPMDESSGVYHGTGVAGVIAAIIDNGQDVAGTAQVKVMALRALGLNGQGSSFNTSQAIRWAAQNGAKIINLSLGTNETFGGPTDCLGRVEGRSLAVQPEGPEGHHFDLGGPRDVLAVIDDGRDDAGDAGPVVHPRRFVHRIRVAADEVVSMGRAVGGVDPHVRLNVLVGPPHPRVDDRDDDRWLAEGHVPRVRRADLLHAPLIKVVRIVRTELCMNGKVRRDALGADDRTGQPADERASDRENGQEYGHPSQ